MSDDSSYSVAYRATQSVYQRKAAWWHGRRGATAFEAEWLDRFLVALPSNPSILDLGCGSGGPITARLRAAGGAVLGLDYAEPMIALAASDAGASGGRWVVGDMRALPFSSPFDGIVSWDGFFHLSCDEQRAALPQMSALVVPGGAMLLTVGPAEGETLGQIDGAPVYHASLSPEEYGEILRAGGFAEVSHIDAGTENGGRCVLFARAKS